MHEYYSYVYELEPILNMTRRSLRKYKIVYSSFTLSQRHVTISIFLKRCLTICLNSVSWVRLQHTINIHEHLDPEQLSVNHTNTYIRAEIEPAISAIVQPLPQTSRQKFSRVDSINLILGTLMKLVKLSKMCNSRSICYISEVALECQKMRGCWMFVRYN